MSSTYYLNVGLAYRDVRFKAISLFNRTQTALMLSKYLGLQFSYLFGV